jgi:hypothetical protein
MWETLMSKSVKITIVRGQEDWEALYVNGKVKTQAHSLDLTTVLYMFEGYTIESVDWFTVNDKAEENLLSWGQFPKTLEEVKAWEAGEPPPKKT